MENSVGKHKESGFQDPGKIAEFLLESYNVIVPEGAFVLLGRFIYRVERLTMSEWDEVTWEGSSFRNDLKKVITKRPDVTLIVKLFWCMDGLQEDAAEDEKQAREIFKERAGTKIYNGTLNELLDEIQYAADITSGAKDASKLSVDAFAMPTTSTTSTAIATLDSKYAMVSRDNALTYSQRIDFKSDLVKIHTDHYVSVIQQRASEIRARINYALVPIKRMVRRLNSLIKQLEMYIGISNKIYVIQDGETATDDPLHIYQNSFFMDEEVGDPSNQGIDFQTIDVFDNWLTEIHPHFGIPNHMVVLPKTKAIALFRPRRKDKHYSSDQAFNLRMNLNNKIYYLLVKNGERLVRIKVTEEESLKITSPLYPDIEGLIKAKTQIMEEMADAYKDEDGPVLHKNYTQRELDEKKELFEQKEFKYKLNLLLLQGLMDREEIFPGEQGKYDLFSDNVLENPNLIWMDDNKDKNALQHNFLPFDDFLADKLGRVNAGDRIIWAGAEGISKEEVHQRLWLAVNKFRDEQALCWSFGQTAPSHGHVYKLEQMTWGQYPEGSADREILRYGWDDYKTRHNTDWVSKPYGGLFVWFNPGHAYSSRDRNRERFAIDLEKDHIVPIDQITEEDLVYLKNLLYSRVERRNYLHLVPMIRDMITFKEAELEFEKPFREALVSHLSTLATSCEDVEQAAKDLVYWWKTKNKHKRPVPVRGWEEWYPSMKLKDTEEEELKKATRMITKEFLKRFL